jgi:hypothetical protein|tara:strand:+ start:261 stop:752 length:492 start_codon:yes stop_codon:yes gene_type:complete
MAGFSYKNKKFPLKAVPTVLITILTSFTVTIGANILLQDNSNFLDLSLFESEEIIYEFQTILETDNFEDLERLELKDIEQCEYYAQSGSFRTEKAAQSQVDQLSNLGYEATIENVKSSNGYNFKVIVGPFENRSQTNNAREIFRQLNMDSIEISACTKIENGS